MSETPTVTPAGTPAELSTEMSTEMSTETPAELSTEAPAELSPDIPTAGQVDTATPDEPREPAVEAAALMAGLDELFTELLNLRSTTALPSSRPAPDTDLAALVSVPRMAVQGWFHTTEAVVEPGGSTTLALMVTNLGEEVEHFALSPTGMAAGWTTIRPAHLTLFGGAQQSVDVEIAPPRLPGTTAGPTSLGVRIVPTGNPDEVANAEITLEVSPTFDRRITVLQPAMRSRRRATFELMIENQGNVQASCRLHLLEPTGRLDGDFDPPAVGVEPGGSTLVRLRTRTARRQWERRALSIPFTIDADQTGAPTVSAVATFIQAPVLPERLWGRLAAAAAATAALAGVWVGVVRPEIERAAVEAVAGLPPPTTAADGVVPDPAAIIDPATTVAPATSTATEPAGRPFSASLPSGGAQFQQSLQTYTVPYGSRLLVTQFIVQNPYGDEGTAVLRIGSIPFEYDLVNLDGIDANQGFLEPLELEGGATITFEVTCGVIGRSGAAACSSSATVIGRLVDAGDGDDAGI